MRGLPPAGVRIDPAFIEGLRTCVQQLAAAPPQALSVRQAREVLKFCAASDAIPEDLKVQALRLLFASQPGTVESTITENAAGEWVHTVFVNEATPRGDWFYAVKHADEGETDELRVLLLSPTAEMTDDGRALLNDFVSRYRIEMTDNGRALWNEVVSRYRIEACFDGQWDMKARARLALSVWKRGKGRPVTPIYALSEIDNRLEYALAVLRALRKTFGRARVDMERVAALHGFSASTLQNALDGKRGSSQRKAHRRKKAMPRP